MTEKSPHACKCAIIVSSCDKFSDLWTPFFRFFFKYWPECPFEVFLIANQQPFEYPGVHTIYTGEDGHWAANTLKALETVKHDYILYLQEDYLFQNAVDETLFETMFRQMIEYDVSCLRLEPRPGADAVFSGSDVFGLISPGQKYRVSLQAALWKRASLIAITKNGENGWEMEHQGSLRADQSDLLFCSVFETPAPEGKQAVTPIDYYCTAVVKGAWEYEALKLCVREGIPTSWRQRPVWGGRKSKLKLLFYMLYCKIFGKKQ